MHQLAVTIAKKFKREGWIDDVKLEWCVYVIEKKTQQALFCVLSTVCAVCTNSVAVTFVFLVSFLNLRKRMGGYHAKTPKNCLLLSVMSVIVNIWLSNSVWTKVPKRIIILTAIVVDVILLIYHPKYPLQLHFGTNVEKENFKRKNLLIAWIALGQTSCILCDRVSISCGFTDGMMLMICTLRIMKYLKRPEE